MTQPALRVLLVDDEASLREPLAKYLHRDRGYAVDTAATAEEARKRVNAANGHYDVALIDDLLTPSEGHQPELLGITLMNEIKGRYPHIECILFTGWSMDAGLEALRAGAYRYIHKPMNPEELAVLIEHAAEYRWLKNVVREKQILERLMETSPALLSGQTLQAVLDVILHGIHSIGFDRVRCYFLSEDRAVMEAQAHVGMDETFIGRTLPMATDGSLEGLSIQHTPQLFHRDSALVALAEQRMIQEEIAEWAYVPLLLRGSIVGMLSLDNKVSGRAIQLGELGPVALFAAQAAAALETARLRAHEQAAAQQAAQRARDIEAIQQASTTLRSLPELAKVPEATCRAAVELFGVDHSGLMLLEPGGVSGLVIAEYPAMGTRGRRVPIRGISAEEKLVATKEPLIIEDVDHDDSLGEVQSLLKEFDIRSILVVPVVHNGKVLGSFSLDSIGHTSQFTEYHIDLCKLFATQVAAAIENRSVVRRLEKEADQFRILYETSAEITASLELGQLLDSIAEQTVRLIDARQSLFLLVDTQARQVLDATGRGYPEEYLQAITFEEVEQGISGWVLQTREAAVVENAAEDERNRGIARQHAQDFNTGPLVVAPLIANGRVIGTLTAINKAGDRSFNDLDKSLVMMLAKQAAIEIEKARLYQETERRRRLLEALDEASRHIRGEKEIARLLHEIVRMAADLVNADMGGLCLHSPELGELEVRVTYKIPETLIGLYLTGSTGLICSAARSGVAALDNDYAADPACEPFLTGYSKLGLLVVPIRQGGDVNAVLFVANTTGKHAFTASDQEILERFAVQAGLAIQTSELMTQDQRRFSHLAILHKMSDYIQAAQDLDKILHVALTGITAGYGLGFNRAALLLKNDQQDMLVGRMGIGYINEEEAWEGWKQYHSGKMDDFGNYLKHLEKNGLLNTTPIDKTIRSLRLLVKASGRDAFSRAVHKRKPVQLTQKRLDELPKDFIHAFEPALPGVVIPLITRDRVVGLLIVDNKFTRTPITHESIEALLTFANTLAIAISNRHLFESEEKERARLRDLYQASDTLISQQEPRKVLEDIVEQARKAAHAQQASVLLIDKKGTVLDFITAEIDSFIKRGVTIRPDGISMQVMKSGTAVAIEDTARHPQPVNPIMFDLNIAAALCLPLHLKGNVIGVMWIHYNQPQQFHHTEIASVQLYVNQAAIAYDNARRLRELEHMRQAAEALAAAGHLQQALQQVVESAQAVLHADSAVAWSYNEVRNTLDQAKSVASPNIPVTIWQEAGKDGPRPGGTIDTIFEQGLICVDDVTDEKTYPFLGTFTRPFLRQIGARSFLGIGLTIGAEKLGILYVNYERPRSFSDEERETAQAFGNHVAMVLKRVKLLEQLQKAREAAGVVAKVTVLGTNLERTLDSVAEGTKAVLDCDAITIYAYDRRKGTFRYPPTMLGVNYPERVSREKNVPNNSIVYTILDFDEPYVASDMPNDPLFKESRFTREEGIVSCIAIPLKVGNEPVGVMFVNYWSAHRFTEEEITSIELFANQAAVAILNTRLFTEVQTQLDELTQTKETLAAKTSLAWTGMITSHWRHSIEGHAMTIVGEVELLRAILAEGTSPETIEPRLAKIERMAKMIQDKPITPPLSSDEGVTSVLINALVSERIGQLWKEHPYRSALVDFKPTEDGKLTVRASPEWLRSAFDTLIDNAVEAVSKQSVKRIAIATESQDGWVRISIKDTGGGIPPEVQQYLFQKPVEKAKGEKGLGIGLLMAETIVQAYGGKVRVASTGPDGTTMVIKLPVEQ